MADEEVASGKRAGQLLQDGDAPTLHSLTSLDLKGVGLTSVPTSLGLCRRLRRLELSGNDLERLPEVIADLPELDTLFAANVALQEVPAALARCPKLRMLGLRDNALQTLDGGRLPQGLAWLIAAGNSIRELPDIGCLKGVRKLMLSHNALTSRALAAVATIPALEMLRAAANRLDDFPRELLCHPRLAWVAVGSNPFTEAALERRLSAAKAAIDFSEVALGPKLGSGAGATVYAGTWLARQVAVKIWEAERFSDGTARGEWAVTRVAAEPGHPSLVGVLGAFEEPRPGMVLELLEGAVAVAGPPSFTSITRDVLPHEGGRGPWLTPAAALRVALSVAQACAYLHEQGVVHGDVYLHNTLAILDAAPADAQAVGVQDVRLSDFGAAAVVDGDVGAGLQRLEVRSFGWLLQDLLDLLAAAPAGAFAASSCSPSRSPTAAGVADLLQGLRRRCAAEDPQQLPPFSEVAATLRAGVAGPDSSL